MNNDQRRESCIRRCIATVFVSILLLAMTSADATAQGDDHRDPGDDDVQRVLERAEQTRDDRLAWWRDARFGMFIHWGIYAQAGGVWNGQQLSGVGEWILHNHRLPADEYRAMAHEFNPVSFDADAWVKLALDAGMKYMVITAKHHDGFCMFDARNTEYDIVNGSPFGRDVIAELAEACRTADLRFGVYYSIWDWQHPDGRGERFPAYVPYMHEHIRQLLTAYEGIDILWFDGEWVDEWTVEYGDELYALCMQLRPDMIVNNRVGKGRHGMANSRTSAGDFGTPEQQIPARGIPGYDWETCMTMNDTWGYKIHDHNWKSTDDLVHKLIDIASKGGNFLLNVGPDASGEIPQPSVERLLDMGRWLARQNDGSSIYGTGPGPFELLPWGRCTARGSRLFLHVFDWPADGVLTVPGLRNEISGVRLLSDDSTLSWQRVNQDVTIDVRSVTPDSIATVVIIDVVGAPQAEAFAHRQAADGSLTLHADTAVIEGQSLRVETIAGVRNLGHWIGQQDRATWQCRIDQPGRFHVVLTLACQPSSSGDVAEIRVGDQSLHVTVPDTGSWQRFIELNAGTIDCSAAGEYAVSVQPAGELNHALMNLRSVRLVPVTASPDGEEN